MSGRRGVIVSISSDIGAALAHRWLDQGWRVWGTCRTRTAETVALEARGAILIDCDLADRESTRRAAQDMSNMARGWDVLVLGSGTLDPIGPFGECEFDAWERSLTVNAVSQLRFVHALLPSKGQDDSTVIFFAGGGTNGAPQCFSAYTAAKILLIKMAELLDADHPDVKSVILGPGWVRTKIHNEVLAAGAHAGAAFATTQAKLARDDFTSMEQVLDCCDWLVATPRAVVGGRNFSVVHDAWGDPRLAEILLTDPDMYKLRRHGNAALQRQTR